MSNETKRDVFDEVADECAGLDYEMYKEYLKRYDAALPDDIPVLPKRIGKFLKIMKSVRADLTSALGEVRSKYNSYAEWAFEDYNSETFARAYLSGVWRVEETGEVVKL
ncbi:hypothetical protein B9J76_11585 [Lacticaseibacillus paracasei]|jgi:hypothetical protein|uniref:hypothetical protein n=1 Tax=Lacticaseibacillus paracasei TaxID=1597 RepID=UPI000A1E118D|nr:hypothetical protein [Lacticaseibacillus paracasei]AYG22372.1 hypothetical protein CFM84_03915 [Lacticaseibacillus paracasei]MCG4283835.1 hypothetical protein [Lacticaseibacillus paracasei]MCT3377839.1 hypothetical protein [Lacticaseibacillus paracasei]OSP83825.1 hypothetical protein B9J76_11585 [Lacticaseibacillus paracasei]